MYCTCYFSKGFEGQFGLAKVLKGSLVTLGTDENIANIVANWGSKHGNTNHGEIVADEDNKLVTTPCYMIDAQISDVYDGATALVKKVLEWA